MLAKFTLKNLMFPGEVLHSRVDKISEGKSKSGKCESSASKLLRELETLLLQKTKDRIETTETRTRETRIRKLQSTKRTRSCIQNQKKTTDTRNRQISRIIIHKIVTSQRLGRTRLRSHRKQHRRNLSPRNRRKNRLFQLPRKRPTGVIWWTRRTKDSTSSRRLSPGEILGRLWKAQAAGRTRALLLRDRQEVQDNDHKKSTRKKIYHRNAQTGFQW